MSPTTSLTFPLLNTYFLISVSKSYIKNEGEEESIIYTTNLQKML